MNELTIIIHSYSSPGLLSCIKSALLLTKNIYVIGEEKRTDAKKFLSERKIQVVPFSNQGIVEPARNFGIKQANTTWIFLLDADETITSELVREIKKAIRVKSYGFYQIPRKEILFHSYWLKYGGWYPNYQTRLIQRSKFVQWPSYIHSTPVIKGKKGILHNPILHYSQNNISEMVNRTIVFESNEADLLYKANRSTSVMIFFRKFFGELYRRLIKGLGFMDGTYGIIESIYQAFSKTITYLFLYEKSRHL
ncbi:MAG: glycosyltransferase [Patescibacteria group bacterium]|jgi:glycosyltransferase involved in cell wall biosynthesis